MKTKLEGTSDRAAETRNPALWPRERLHIVADDVLADRHLKPFLAALSVTRHGAKAEREATIVILHKDHATGVHGREAKMGRDGREHHSWFNGVGEPHNARKRRRVVRDPAQNFASTIERFSTSTDFAAVPVEREPRRSRAQLPLCDPDVIIREGQLCTPS